MAERELRGWQYFLAVRRLTRAEPGTSYHLFLYAICSGFVATASSLVFAAFVATPLGPAHTWQVGVGAQAVVFGLSYVPYSRWQKRRFDQWKERLRARGVDYL